MVRFSTILGRAHGAHTRANWFDARGFFDLIMKIFLAGNFEFLVGCFIFVFLTQ